MNYHQPPTQAETQYDPIMWIGFNLVGVVGSFLVGSFIGLFATAGKDMVSYALGGVLLYTIFAAINWYKGWMLRDYQMREIDLYDVNSSQMDTHPRNVLLHEINTRSSNVLFSYILFFLPHAFWLGLGLH